MELNQVKDFLSIQRDLALSLSAVTRLDEGLRVCLETAMEVSGMDCGGIYLVDALSGALHLAFHKGLSSEFVKDTFQRNVESPNTKCVMVGKFTYTQRKNLNVPLNPAEQHEGLRAFAVLPVLHNNQVISCINLASHTLDEVPPFCRPALETISAEMGSTITRLRAEEALRESEEHLRSMVENATEFALYRLALDGTSSHKLRVVFVSPSITEIMDVSDPMEFETWFKNIHPDDLDHIVEANLLAFETFGFNELMRIYHPEKEEWRWIRAISVGIPDEQGHPEWINGILIDETERMRAEKALKEREDQLEIKTLELKETNTALRVLLRRREKDKKRIEALILSNVKESVEPYLHKLKQTGLTPEQKIYFGILESNIEDIISPFLQGLPLRDAGLAPREIEVAFLVKAGRNTREIARLLNIAKGTVDRYRESIRKKLGIKNSKTNLRVYLRSLQ